jgi:hypothetical protein
MTHLILESQSRGEVPMEETVHSEITLNTLPSMAIAGRGLGEERGVGGRHWTFNCFRFQYIAFICFPQTIIRVSIMFTYIHPLLISVLYFMPIFQPERENTSNMTI